MIYSHHIASGLKTCVLVTIFCLLANIGWSAPPLRVVYGFDREFPPFSYEEPGGKPTGFEVELLQAVLEGANVVLSTRPLTWENVPLELSAGTINVTSGMVKTEGRNKLFSFTDKASFSLQIRLFTKIYNRFPSLSFFRGQMVSVEKGSYQHRMLEAFGGVNIKTFDGRVAALRALYNDEVVAFCGPVQPTYYYINKLNYGAITSVGTPLGVAELRFAVNKGRGDILKVVNEGLNKVIASGEYDRIFRKWFVRELSSDEKKGMLDLATRASIPAYAPYTAKAQGAAVLTATGKIHTGVTVENADPAMTTTALQNALAKSIAEGDFEVLAAVVVNQAGQIEQPTLEDLQRLYEFGRGILILQLHEGTNDTSMVSQLLPNPVTGKIFDKQVEY